MKLPIKRKITLSTIMGSLISIISGFAVNKESDRKWRAGSLFCLVILILINNFNSIEENFFESDLKILESNKKLEDAIIVGSSEVVKQFTKHIADGNLQEAKEREKIGKSSLLKK